MTNTSFNYYLRSINKSQDQKLFFEKIIEYLMTFVGDIEVKREDSKTAIVYYIGTPTSTLLKLEKTGQITVTISLNDNVTINLINNLSKNVGFRVYNPQINSYLLNDVNIYDLTTIKIDSKIADIIKKYGLTPLFQYRDSLIFFAKAKDESIHLINRHLLEHLVTNPDSKLFKSDFSIKVAKNISEFVALFDRGLISLNFQNNVTGNAKVINLSGFDMKKLPKGTILQVINFRFDEENQQFIQEGTDEKIKGNRYLAMKIGQDYTYRKVNDKLVKVLNISIYN